MKLYLIPVEKLCNASCGFCITDSRKTSDKEFIDIGDLDKIIRSFVHQEIEKIEITGGGEPTLHPHLNEIIDICSSKTKTQLYTNGSTFLRKIKNLDELEYLCISRTHYDERENERIMGIKQDISYIKLGSTPIKLSLILLKSGINKRKEILSYLHWAEKFAKKVVIRQLFQHDDPFYQEKFKEEFVSTEKLAGDLNLDYKIMNNGNRTFRINNLEVEIEQRSCACEISNLVLHADGKLYKGWGQTI